MPVLAAKTFLVELYTNGGNGKGNIQEISYVLSYIRLTGFSILWNEKSE